MWRFFFNKNDLRPLGCVLSVLLSIFILNTNNPPLDVDGLIYLRTAQMYVQQGLIAALNAFDWPFYSVLIGILSHIFHISLEHAADSLDVLGTALFVFAFQSILREIGTQYRLQVITLCVVLLFPELNILRKLSVLRDFMYWGCIFTALLYLIRAGNTRRLSDSLRWGCFALLAGLFRIEGLFFLAVMPLVFLTLTTHWSARFSLCLKNYAVLLLMLVVLFLLCAIHPATWFTYTHRLQDIFQVILGQQAVVKAKILAVSHALFSTDEQRQTFSAGAFLFFGALGIIFMMVIKLSSYLYALFSLHAGLCRLMPPAGITRRMIIGFILGNVVLLMVFFYTRFFFADRYLLCLTLAVLLFAPLSLEYIYTCWHDRAFVFAGRRWFFPLIVICIIGVAEQGLYRAPYSKAYITTSGQWLAAHTDAHDELCTNNGIILHYARRTGNDTTHQPSDITAHCQYVVIQFNRKTRDAQNTWRGALGNPFQEFHGPQQAAVLIWRLPSQQQLVSNN